MKTTSAKILASLAIASALALLPTAQALPTLRISVDGGADTIVQDGVAPDASAGANGIVVWAGSIGSWSVIVSTGTTKPAQGSATAADMHLNITGTNNSAVSSILDVRFSEDFYGPINNGSFMVNRATVLDQSGTNSTETNAWFGPNNTLFETGSLLGTSTFTGAPQAQSANSNSGAFTDAAYSLTTQVKITHAGGTGGGKTTSGQIQVIQNAPDGGLTVTLLGSVLLALAAIRRKLFAA